MNPIDAIWRMGVASLFSNNNQVVLPFDVAEALGDNGINELKSRFSALFDGASVATYEDHASNVLRIGLLSNSPTSSTEEFDFASPLDSTPTVSAGAVSTATIRSPGKKSKVPRPPNSFILYRQEHHPKLKAQNPGLHNNDISVILGKQWALEPESVKEKYKAQANAIKQQHAAENPGYQYAPRRPSEKKRRMTARKIAQLEPSVNGQTPESIHDTIHLTDSEPSPDANHQDMMATEPNYAMTAIRNLGLQRPAMDGTLSGNNEAMISVSMPMQQENFATFQQQFDGHVDPESYGALPFDDFNREALTVNPELHVSTDQAWMNALLDWEGLENDACLIQQIMTEEEARIEAELGGPDLRYVMDATTKFQEELERLYGLI